MSDVRDTRRMPPAAFLPTRAPRRTTETAAFWDGCADGRFMLPRCDDCGHLVWYPRLHCPECHSGTVAYVETSGRGTLHSYTVIARASGPFRDAVPYLFVMIELDEGPRLVTNLVGVDIDPSDVERTVRIGDRVEVVFEPVAGSSDRLFRFRPSSGNTADGPPLDTEAS